MQRFFIPPECIRESEVIFPDSTSRQMVRVLHLKDGDRCVVLDDLGSECVVEIVHADAAECQARVLEKRAADEPKVRLGMLLCLTQREKFEWMLQKCTEVGAAEFQPVISQRSLVQDKRDVEGKYERWRMILKEAAEQSGRGIIPNLRPPVKFTEAVVSAAGDYELCLLPWEGEHQNGIKAVLGDSKPGSAAVLIGPEGGFSEGEAEQARSAGFTTVTLGRRILRMETAAVVSAALVLHELEATITNGG